MPRGALRPLDDRPLVNAGRPARVDRGVRQDAGMMRRLEVRSIKVRRLLQNLGFLYNDDGTFTYFHAMVPRKADGSPRFGFREPRSPKDRDEARD